MREINRNTLDFAFWLFLNTIFLIIVFYALMDSRYTIKKLSKELNKTNAEKALLMQKLEAYESAVGKH